MSQAGNKPETYDISKSLPDEQVKLLSPTQQAGMRLALGVGLLIAVVTATVCVLWFQDLPTRPNIAADKVGSPETHALLENYRLLVEISMERATKLFDLVVVKALLPVFTAILGYIFGSRDRGEVK